MATGIFYKILIKKFIILSKYLNLKSKKMFYLLLWKKMSLIFPLFKKKYEAFFKFI